MPFTNHHNNSIHRKRNKTLGVLELIAIALGGMVGGGIFTILGISVSMIGAYTPLAIIIGGIMASLAAYSYIKLSIYYKDEGATYSFYKRTFPQSPFAASLIGWWIVFGYAFQPGVEPVTRNRHGVRVRGVALKTTRGNRWGFQDAINCLS